MFELDFPWAFALLPAPFVVWWLLPPYQEQRESVRVPFFEQLAAAVGVEPAKGGVLLRNNWLQKVVAPVVWILTIVALARPQYVEPPIEKIGSARDLMLAIDLSGSMDTRDMFDVEGDRVNRLEMVKQVLEDFIDRREGDRIGVIVFGNQAFLQAPFTQDHDLVRTLLDQVEPRMAGPQTMLGDAIGLAIKVFDGSENDAEDRVLVLLTDGNDTGSRVPPRKAAEIAARNEVTVYTVAVGDPRSTGEAEIDLETLESIATVTGGKSFSADDREQLEGIYRQIDALTPEEIETLSYRPTRPLFHYPLGIAIALVLAYHFIMAVGALYRRYRHSRARHA